MPSPGCWLHLVADGLFWGIPGHLKDVGGQPRRELLGHFRLQKAACFRVPAFEWVGLSCCRATCCPEDFEFSVVFAPKQLWYQKLLHPTLIPGQVTLPFAICHLTNTPVPGIEGLYVMQGYYKNPGPKQSRSARWGKDHRSGDEALSLVLACMEMHGIAADYACIKYSCFGAADISRSAANNFPPCGPADSSQRRSKWFHSKWFCLSELEDMIIWAHPKWWWFSKRTPQKKKCPKKSGLDFFICSGSWCKNLSFFQKDRQLLGIEKLSSQNFDSG